jgi:hypothetical protein
MSFRKDLALSTEEELEAATTVCLMLSTPRVVGSRRRSLVKVWAMPPGIMNEQSYYTEGFEAKNQ